jgi:ABC-2 type transport system permease protein
MRKIAILARREYQALIRTKAFILSLVIMPVFMFGAIFVQTYLQEHIDTGEKTIVVLDGTGRLLAPLQALAEVRGQLEADDQQGSNHKPRKSIKLEAGPAGPVTDEMRLELSDRIRRNEIFAFAEIDADALKPSDDSPLMQLLRNMGALKSKSSTTDSKAGPEPSPLGRGQGEGAENASDTLTPTLSQREREPNNHAAIRMYMQTIVYNEIGQWFTQAVNQAAFALRLSDAGLNPAVVAQAACPINFAELAPYTKTAAGEIHKGDEGSRGVAFFVPFVLMMLMFMSVMIVGQPMLTSVIEEKQQRIAEVLLGSVSPFQLMMGKLLGNVGVALTIVAIYLTGGYFVAQHYGYTELVPASLLMWFIAFEIMACLLFGAVFIAVGAACTEIKEAQSMLMPVMVVLVMPMMVWFNVMQEPLSNFATWISLFPPATPLLMLLRVAASPMVPLWQPVLGMILVVAAAVLCIFAAGRVFRIGILLQGKAPKMSELIGWIARG